LCNTQYFYIIWQRREALQQDDERVSSAVVVGQTRCKVTLPLHCLSGDISSLFETHSFAELFCGSTIKYSTKFSKLIFHLLVRKWPLLMDQPFGFHNSCTLTFRKSIRNYFKFIPYYTASHSEKEKWSLLKDMAS
jgi:hypothetical protein